MTPEDNYFMQFALNEARAASSRGDVPVGAVIVKDHAVLAAGSDSKSFDPTAHAEITAIRSSAQRLGHWNLSGCTLYVTLEPCPMCAGACVNARVSRVVYGAKNYKSGAAGTLYDILRDSRLNHVCEVKSGVMEAECLGILQNYFLRRRVKASCSKLADSSASSSDRVLSSHVRSNDSKPSSCRITSPHTKEETSCFRRA